MQFRREDVKGKLVDIATIMAHCTAENASQRIMIEQAVVQLIRARGGIADAPQHVRGGVDFGDLPPPLS